MKKRAGAFDPPARFGSDHAARWLRDNELFEEVITMRQIASGTLNIVDTTSIQRYARELKEMSFAFGADSLLRSFSTERTSRRQLS